MTTTKNLSSIAVNSIFAQVFNTDPVQEDPGVNNKISFERGYKMFGQRAITVIFKG